MISSFLNTYVDQHSAEKVISVPVDRCQTGHHPKSDVLCELSDIGNRYFLLLIKLFLLSPFDPTGIIDE
jgi:hypothetical protein